MLPGYVSAILMIMALILIVSGWKKELAGDASRLGLVLFLGGWALGSLWTFPVADSLGVSLVTPVVGVAVWFAVLRTDGALERLNALSAGCFMAGLYVLYMYWLTMNPILVIHSPMTDVSMAFSLLVFIMVRRAQQQLIILSVSLCIGEALFQRMNGGTRPLIIGGATFQDMWWLTMALTRGWTALAAHALGLGRWMLGVWQKRRH